MIDGQQVLGGRMVAAPDADADSQTSCGKQALSPPTWARTLTLIPVFGFICDA